MPNAFEQWRLRFKSAVRYDSQSLSGCAGVRSKKKARAATSSGFNDTAFCAAIAWGGLDAVGLRPARALLRRQQNRERVRLQTPDRQTDRRAGGRADGRLSTRPKRNAQRLRALHAAVVPPGPPSIRPSVCLSVVPPATQVGHR